MLSKSFAVIVKWRWLFVVLYGLLLPPLGYFAAKVTQDSSIERLIIASDPDFSAMRDFQKTFGAGEYAVIAFEADNPFDRGVLERIDKAEQALLQIEGVSSNSATSILGAQKRDFR
ncbi:MAG: hypothetical protein IPK82_09505 [Polyangiaceae bacterium]|nr:hypothetical protein [Polyangiaceae bacterium]